MAMKIKEKKETFSPLTIVMLIILVLYCISFFYLLLWGISSSFKINKDLFDQEKGKLFYGYFDYTKYLNGEIDKAWLEVAKFHTVSPRTLADGNLAEAHAENLVAKLLKITNVKDQMGVLGLPFYSYKYTFKVFEYRLNDKFIGLGEMYVNSILYACGCGFAAAAVPCIAAYACARFPYKFSRIMHTTVIIVMMIPIVGSQPSELDMVSNVLHMYNKRWSLWVMRANFLGLYFLMYYEVCKALPASFSEAAKMDGANNFQVFFKISLPLIKNTFLTVFLIQTIGFWNDYQTPMIYTPSFPTVAMGLNELMSKAGGDPHLLGDNNRFDMTYTSSRMAAAVLTAVPVCTLFACFQKRLLGNLTVGGIKG